MMLVHDLVDSELIATSSAPSCRPRARGSSGADRDLARLSLAHPTLTPSAVGRTAQLLQRRSELTSALQPIVRMEDHREIGREALLRLPFGSGFANVGECFSEAARAGLLVELELVALEVHLSLAPFLGTSRLFLNLSAMSLADPRLRSEVLGAWVESVGLRPDQVVLELTESVSVTDPGAFARWVQPLRQVGFALAIDDFGAGFTSLRLLAELAPDYLKVDRSLVGGASSRPNRRAVLESLVGLGDRIGAAVLAEGVETPEDLVTVGACGVAYAQGFELGPPIPASELRFRAAAPC
jgi:EAL domain-containing protein (putative c-di-GMP-specific phosphodiesterase class I)